MFSPELPPQAAFACLDFTAKPPPVALPEEEALLSSRAGEKRINSFRAGRAAAHAVLERLGRRPSPPILRGAGGELLWPCDIAGSITHCRHLAAAAAAPDPPVRSIGLDIEDTRRLLTYGVSRHICSPDEEAWAEAVAVEKQARIVIIFSAKETAYKTLFPLCRRFFGFHDLFLTWRSPGCFEARLASALAADLPEGFSFFIRYQIHEPFVLTYAVLSY